MSRVAPRLAEMGGCEPAPQIPVAVFLTRFEPGGTERQMTELIRRLDPARFSVHVACFHREGAWLPRVVERAARSSEFPIHGFARPATVWQLFEFARWCRRERIAVVQTCDLLREHLRLAWSGAGRRAGPHRQPPRAQPGQDRRADSSAAAGLSLCHEGRRQLAGGAPDARAGGRRGIVHCGDSQRRRRSTAFAERKPTRTDPDASSPSPTCDPRRATRPCSPRRPCCCGPIRTCTFRSSATDRGVASSKRCRARADCRAHVEFLGHREDVPALLGGGRRLRPALALRGVSQRRDRGDGGRPSGRRQRRRRPARSHRQTAGPDCSCRREIPRRWRARSSR